jgi:hypothetical protein
MTCAEIAAVIEATLIRQRDPRWMREAQRHATQCPSCARLMKLHRAEELLTGLPAVAPSGGLLDTVMKRIAEPASFPRDSRRGSSLAIVRSALMLVGAVILAAANLVPTAGSNWVGNVMPTLELVRSPGMFAYLADHPPGAVLVAGFATVLILLALSIPERHVGELA